MTLAANSSKKPDYLSLQGWTIFGLFDKAEYEDGSSPGLMKLFGDGGRLNSLVMLGDEKSSISSLKMIPVDGDMIRDPKL